MNAVTQFRQNMPTTTDQNDLIRVLESSLYPGASPESISLVLGYCRAAGLDPMQRPVHIVPMWDSKARRMRDVIMPGISSYRTAAARTGQYAGIGDPDFGPDVSETISGVSVTYPQWCRVTVKRALPNGTIVEFSAREYWRECYAVKGGQEKSQAPNAMWAKRPYGMLAKCAEAQALRKAFPEIGAAPTAEEMGGQTLDAAIDVTPAPQPAPALPQRATYDEAGFNAALEKWRSIVQSGRKTVGDILATVSSKYELTAEQRQAITELEVPAEQAWIAEYDATEEGDK